MAQPAQVLIISPAETPARLQAEHLTSNGKTRAKAWVPFLTTDPEMVAFGVPVALFALKLGKARGSDPTHETLALLAGKLRLPILAPCPAENYEELAKAILSNPLYQGKNVVVC